MPNVQLPKYKLGDIVCYPAYDNDKIRCVLKKNLDFGIKSNYLISGGLSPPGGKIRYNRTGFDSHASKGRASCIL